MTTPSASSFRLWLALPIAVLLVSCRAARKSEAPREAAPDGGTAAFFGDAADLAARDRLRQPEKVIAALGLAPGARVADVGAGHGYLTFRLANAVGPTGRVVATDIDAVALATLRAHQPAASNVVVRKVAPDDPGLEAGAYDLILLSEVDHYLPDRVAYLTKLRAALAPGGRIAVTNRRGFRPLVVAAAERAGFAVTGAVKDLPSHFLLFLQPSRR